MRVALIGGTGFIGGYIIDGLLDAGHEPAVLVRAGSESKLRSAERCRRVSGDLSDRDAIARLMSGADAAIYLVGILREQPSKGITFEAIQYHGARRAIDVAVEQGVGRFLLMSANGAHAGGTPYERTKFEAERYLERSTLAGTAFRPSIVFGDPRGAMEFCTQLRDQMVRPPLPAASFFAGVSPAAGAAVMSPVHVEDVAAAFVGALEDDGMAGNTYALGGPEMLTWPDVIRRIAKACGRRKWIVPVPAPLVRLGAFFLDRFRWFPVTRDQLTMLMQGNVVEDNEAFDRLGIDPQRMTPETLSYLRQEPAP